MTGLFLERAREPVAPYFAVGLSLFAGSGGLGKLFASYPKVKSKKANVLPPPSLS